MSWYPNDPGAATAFWKLSPCEFWWIAEVKRPKKMYGSMDEDTVAQLYEDTYGTENSGSRGSHRR